MSLQLPPLRERKGDLSLLLDQLLKKVNEDLGQESGYEHKKLSPGARNILISHPWPGNVRELLNTLQRAAFWTSETTIRSEDVREALLPVTGKEESKILDRPLGDDLNLPDLLASVARHYLTRALDETQGNKTQASPLGRPSKLPNVHELVEQIRGEPLMARILHMHSRNRWETQRREKRR